MLRTRFCFSASVLVFSLAACSSDDDASDATVNANQPAAGRGGSAGAAAGSGGGGSAGAPSAAAGAGGATDEGASGEGQGTDIGLEPGATDEPAGAGDGDNGGPERGSDAGASSTDAGSNVTPEEGSLSFFVSSQNNTGDLGGLAGADAICQTLAEAAGSARTWAAYLSADDGGNGQPVNARDRIGAGPWFNAAGVMLAADLAALHALPSGDPAVFLDENGERINGQWAGSPTPNQHDVMTGSNADGTLLAGTTCNNWTSAGADIGGPRLGHADGLGPGMNGAPPFNSWNSSHTAPNCTAAGLAQVGGAGKIYCFASD